jgi:hypothetical protein
MTRTWLKRLLVVAPIVATTSAGFAQTPPPAAPAKPAAAAPASKPAAPVTKPAVAHPPAGPSAKPLLAAPGKPPLVVPAAPGPKPAPELEQLKFLLGKWLHCDGKQLVTPVFGPEHTFKAVAESKVASDGFWHQFTYEEKKSPTHHGFKVQGLWGWDQGGKHLVRVGATNAGDWDVGSAPGLEGDKIVWTGDMSGSLGRMGYRQIFVKKSDKEWSFTFDLKDPTGKLTPFSEVTCKR